MRREAVGEERVDSQMLMARNFGGIPRDTPGMSGQIGRDL
ncbi:hypothetical protein FM113_17530 [Leucobacter sp. 7(1)]|nr:hypothetical protein FM113_17530 [Leucobacter sp. 7(1)]